jgi:hypothetical protein
MIFLLLLSVVFNLFWFTAQLAFESLTDRHDDWYWILQMNPPAVWRIVGAAVGIGGYVIVARGVAALIRDPGGPKSHAIRLGYVAAAASAVLFGAFLLVQARGLGPMAASRLSP